VLFALGIAGLVNMAMLAMAAKVFSQGHAEVASIETAFHTLVPLLGVGAAAVFLASLLASGLSSSVVGTMAGQTIMQDFVRFRIPLSVRRLATMVPAVIVVAMGADSTHALVLSQVVLSLVLPVPMIALLVLSGRRDVMGGFVTSRLTRVTAVVAAVVVLALNLLLLLQTAGVPVSLSGSN
jgi:manganese transport protein